MGATLARVNLTYETTRDMSRMRPTRDPRIRTFRVPRENFASVARSRPNHATSPIADPPIIRHLIPEEAIVSLSYPTVKDVRECPL